MAEERRSSHPQADPNDPQDATGEEVHEVVCLDEETLLVAKRELNEDPAERDNCILTFRTWLLDQPYITCPIDSVWLLRFLRYGKFSQLAARQALIGYLSCKSELPDWLDTTDTANPDFQGFLKTGVVVPLPGRDDDGRQVILLRTGCYDPSNAGFNPNTICQGYFAVLLWCLQDQRSQVHGVSILLDWTNFNVNHQSFVGLNNLIKLLKIMQGSFPLRFHKFHCYNHGTIFETLYTLVKSFLSPKLIDRVVMHGNNLQEIYNNIPMRLLPAEYCPEGVKNVSAGPLQQIIENFQTEMSGDVIRQCILEETSVEYSIDESGITTGSTEGSYRKLNTD